jgi:hypothetical protein
VASYSCGKANPSLYPMTHLTHSMLWANRHWSLRNNLDFERCGFLGLDAASNGNFLPMFRDDLLVLSSRLKKYS